MNAFQKTDELRRSCREQRDGENKNPKVDTAVTLLKSRIRPVPVRQRSDRHGSRANQNKH